MASTAGVHFAIIKEGKTPTDRRVVFSPAKILEAKTLYSKASFTVQASGVRVFKNEAYQELGIPVCHDIKHCDVLIGVKEVPIEDLIPDKTYFFFSHTIKKQPYSKALLKAILDKNITLYDHETLIDKSGNRLVGFGSYAGSVGVYNGFRAWGLKHDTWQLPKAVTLEHQNALKEALLKLRLPNIKILLTGKGNVAISAKHMLDALCIKEVSVNDYLTLNFNEPVYCNIDVLDYNKRNDGKVLNEADFFNNPKEYQSCFMPFAKVTQYYIAGHYYANDAPSIITKADAKHPEFSIKVIADISCDINGPIAPTFRASTIENPIYGYNTVTGQETHYKNKNAITVMAIDNLPCELPKAASEGFGTLFLKHVMPAFFNNDKDGLLERARITKNGNLTPRFTYLKDYVED